MFVVDTNVLVYAADQDSPFHDRCRGLLEGWRAQPSAWFLTWGILYEFLRVSTHARVFRRPWPVSSAWSFVEAVLSSPALGILVSGERHRQVAASVVREVPHLAGNFMHDAHTAVLMREHGIRRIYTRDTDFHRFPFLEPLDPMA
ncbi:MAG TPA: TA system VapC family ribonuclease toxin [Bryobacteraceae bacterium]|nr:TA system VapC family ribonuclease toxin [Bryobacteraceae bacterium]